MATTPDPQAPMWVAPSAAHPEGGPPFIYMGWVYRWDEGGFVEYNRWSPASNDPNLNHPNYSYKGVEYVWNPTTQKYDTVQAPPPANPDPNAPDWIYAQSPPSLHPAGDPPFVYMGWVYVWGGTDRNSFAAFFKTHPSVGGDADHPPYSYNGVGYVWDHASQKYIVDSSYVPGWTPIIIGYDAWRDANNMPPAPAWAYPADSRFPPQFVNTYWWFWDPKNQRWATEGDNSAPPGGELPPPTSGKQSGDDGAGLSEDMFIAALAASFGLVAFELSR